MNIDIHLKECATSDHYQHLNCSILKMQKKFDEYWPIIKDDAIACQLLDPRFKHYTLKSNTNKQNVKVFIRFFLSNDIFFNEIRGSLDAWYYPSRLYSKTSSKFITNITEISASSTIKKSLFLYIKDFKMLIQIQML